MGHGNRDLPLYDDEGNKRCARCDKYKPASDYVRGSSARTYASCNLCSELRSLTRQPTSRRNSRPGGDALTQTELLSAEWLRRPII